MSSRSAADKWEIYIGGAAGAHIRKGDLLATVDVGRGGVTLAGRFIQYYRENAKWLERTYAFVPRVGLEELQSVVVETAKASWPDGRADADGGGRLPGPLEGAQRRRNRPHNSLRRSHCCRFPRCRSDDRPDRGAFRGRGGAGQRPDAGRRPDVRRGEPSGRRIPVVGTAPFGRWMRCARTRAGPSPTDRSTPPASMCPLHQYTFAFDTGTCASEGVGSVRTYSASVREGSVVVHV